MQTQFSPGRVWLLIKKHWQENKKWFLFATLAMLGILSIIIYLLLQSMGHTFFEGSINVFFLAGFFLSGLVFASTSFSLFGNQVKGAGWLLVPASHFEKLLAVMFYNLIAFPLVYGLCYWLLKSGVDAYIQLLMQQQPARYHYSRVPAGQCGAYSWVFFVFFALQSVFVAGAVYFKRYCFFITSIVVMVAVLLWLYLTGRLITSLQPKGSLQWAFSYVSQVKNGESTFKVYPLSHYVEAFYTGIIRYALAPFFWLLTWVKLKEKQL